MKPRRRLSPAMRAAIRWNRREPIAGAYSLNTDSELAQLYPDQAHTRESSTPSSRPRIPRIR